MKFSSSCWRGSVYFALIVLASTAGSELLAKTIHLRNTTIIPSSAAGQSAQPFSLAAPVSGLFLVQFKTDLNPEMRTELSGLGLDLLSYVPEDTFVARARAVRLELIRALPYVDWVGNYQPGYKIHASLQTKAARASAAAGTAAEVGVAVLLAPRLVSAEIASARSLFSKLGQDSDLSSGHILRGWINPARLQRLAQSEAVLWVEAAPVMRLFDESSSRVVAGDGESNELLTQSLGYDGAGVTVAVADSGLNNGDAETMHPDLYGRTPAFFYYGGLTDAADEHSHGTHVAGIIAGNGATGEVDENGMLYGLGVAPGASVVTQRIFDGVGNYYPPPSFEKLTRDAYRAGAVIGSNSWGDDTQGRYDLSAREFDALVRDADEIALGDQQYILEFSAGNAGYGAQTIGSPAVAKNVIASGACESDRTEFLIYGDGRDTMADFSSRGPCEDGRIKPDVVAPGTYIASLQSYSATADYAWAEISPNYQYQGGTSQAGPHVSGAVAVFVQYYRQTHNNATPSPAMVKAALINSATDMDDTYGTGPVPNMDEGWGRVNLPSLFDSAINCLYQEQGPLLTNGAVFEKRVLAGSLETPLTITLTWTDVPGLPAAIPSLVNDLDLEVVAPDGTLYRGNQFQDGESVPNPSGFDRINNVEGVKVWSPLPGEYTIRVRGHRVVADSVRETGAVDQDFAMVISGQFAAPGTGIISTDRRSYRASDRIKLQLTDSDLAGKPSATVKVLSSVEPLGETVLLSSSSSSGVFTGSVATATGTAVADGRLQVAHGSSITVQYFDASAQVMRQASAVADLVPPVLSGVAVTNSFGDLAVSWSSDEAATSIVRYGTNHASLADAITNSILETDHWITLGRLPVGTTWYFYVVSQDEAGNISTNNNGGTLYSIVVPATPPVLVVDGETEQLAREYAPDIGEYTSALTQLGIACDAWDVLAEGAPPTTNTLKAYRAVIWRVSEWAAPSTEVQNTISNYVNAGGSLLIASMDFLSRLSEVGATGFAQNVLHVADFVPDPESTGGAEIVGVPSDPITSGLDIVLDFSFYADENSIWPWLGGPDFSDTISPAAGATPILRNDFGDIVGLRWPGFGQQASGKVVFLSFALDAVPMVDGVNDRLGLLRKLMAFLAPGASGLPQISLGSPSYALPSVASVELADPARTGRGTAVVQVRSTTDSAGFSVALVETSEGVFRGSFDIISGTNAPSTSQLRAMPGDSLTVEYSSGVNSVSAMASIDVAAPAISGVAAEPDYTQATVYWDTTEPADALVQFGESSLLNRTAYAADYSDAHAVVLQGLVPDRAYYYQVVSRDAAGNAVTDDNNGALYSLHTLKPFTTPYSDDMESGAPGWTTYSEPIADGLLGTQVDWELGIPTNGLAPVSSPAHGWGVNLGGNNIDLADAFLISPPIYLANGNKATLTFWQNYDFPVIDDYEIEMGTIYVSANNGPLVQLTALGDSSYGWEQVNLDLSPYIGQVVNLVWEYFLFSMDASPRPGWLIDDVSVKVDTVETPQAGTIVVTNNLWHGWFLLSGTQAANGVASAVFTNMPAGEYTFEPRQVEFYNTPPAQTKILPGGGVITFESNYTFEDVNGNGIADAWEQHWFGAVSPSRTSVTDTDGDGMSDRAEFLAGTDSVQSPTNTSIYIPPPNLKVSGQALANGSLRLVWQTSFRNNFPSRAYRVVGSTNLVDWVPQMAWTPAPSGSMTNTLPPVVEAIPRFYRVEVAP